MPAHGTQLLLTVTRPETLNELDMPHHRVTAGCWPSIAFPDFPAVHSAIRRLVTVNGYLSEWLLCILAPVAPHGLGADRAGAHALAAVPASKEVG